MEKRARSGDHQTVQPVFSDSTTDMTYYKVFLCFHLSILESYRENELYLIHEIVRGYRSDSTSHSDRHPLRSKCWGRDLNS